MTLNPIAMAMIMREAISTTRLSKAGDPPQRNYAVAPGEYITEYLQENEIPVKELGVRLGLNAHQMKDLIIGSTPVTDELATELEAFTGIPARSWLRIEAAYQADIARLYPDNR